MQHAIRSVSLRIDNERPTLEWAGRRPGAGRVLSHHRILSATRGISGQPGAPPATAPVRAWAQRDYGTGRHLRLMECLSKHGVPPARH